MSNSQTVDPFIASQAATRAEAHDQVRPAISIVAPCYNEELCLPEFLRRAHAACRELVGDDYEIILVDDGSNDRTWDLIATQGDARLIGVRLSRNFGHQRALTAGLAHCAGERILAIDADLQDPPELLGQMLSVMEDTGAEVVYGRRRTRQGETRFKHVTSALFYRLLSRLIDISIPLDTGDFRLMTRRVLEVLMLMPEENRFLRGMISWVGMKQVPMLYDRDPRFAGMTGYSLGKMMLLALDAVTGFSVVPLRVASYVGMVTGIVSVFLLLYTIGSWAMGVAVSGWTSLASIVLVLGSVQLLVLGVMGEYLGRLFMTAKRRPLFVVQEIVSNGFQGPPAPDGEVRRGSSPLRGA